ncbi:DUF7694 domain-containing protein [Microseira wollei]|uniref:DUF7694 domain-containing protein n=1 Tax=Microseira wollei NIES-4236 TaxID=2530354 RepID=A0AAV3XDY8_9CYAN|nr:hypothetical protein [Microseira wollei]GET39658.1 hypothetical protein MiSe_44290 [Microseira wollei NIES-4236]
MGNIDFPCWLFGKAKFVAEKLLADGFWYCGNSDNFVVIEDLTEQVGDWLLGFGYQELGLDAICDGALFFKDLDHFEEQSQFESEINRIKNLIIQSELDWESGLSAGQACLRLAMKAFNKGFSKTNEWIWVPPSEIEAKKKLVSAQGTVPNCQSFCYNNQFRVMFFARQTEWVIVNHLMGTQHNGKRINDQWATWQQIKNELVGSEGSVEVYPPMSELVNDMNAYHLWVMPPGFKLPNGIESLD